MPVGTAGNNSQISYDWKVPDRPRDHCSNLQKLLQTLMVDYYYYNESIWKGKKKPSMMVDESYLVNLQLSAPKY